jgi:hypothetical protein
MITVQKNFYMLSAIMAATAMLAGCAPMHVTNKNTTAHPLTMSHYVHTYCNYSSTGNPSGCAQHAPLAGWAYPKYEAGDILSSQYATSCIEHSGYCSTRAPKDAYIQIRGDFQFRAVASSPAKIYPYLKGMANSQMGNPVISAGLIAGGLGASVAGPALGVAGIALDLIGGGQKIITMHWSPSVPYPFLAFYRFIPYGPTATVDGEIPRFEQAYNLMFSARNGVSVVSDGIEFHANQYRVDTRLVGNPLWVEHSNHAYLPVYATSLTEHGGAIWWGSIYKMNGAQIFLHKNTSKDATSRDAQFIMADVGQPKTYYTIAVVSKILHSYNFGKHWYAVFDFPVPHGIDVVVAHNGVIEYMHSQLTHIVD